MEIERPKPYKRTIYSKRKRERKLNVLNCYNSVVLSRTSVVDCNIAYSSGCDELGRAEDAVIKLFKSGNATLDN